MTSQECFNKIQHYINGTKLSGKELLECYVTIDKDLDRLEKLEKENQELAETLELYNEKFAGFERVKTDLIQENQKLKNAIKNILKYDIDLLKVKQFSYEGYVGYCKFVHLLIPTQEEYELLNEVVCNGKI